MLVGRASDLEALTAQLDGDRPVALLGERGIGKTSLLRAAIASSRRRSFEGGGLSTLSWMPYLPVTRALGGSFPDGDAAWPAGEVERTVGTGGLVLDDVQWADRETLSLLPMLAGRVAWLAALRRGDNGTNPALAALEAAGAEVVPVGPLDEASAAELVRRSRPDLPAAEVTRLVRRSGCNPLLLQELSAQGGGQSAGSLQRAMAARLRPLSAEACRAVELLAVAGRPLDEALLGVHGNTLIAAGLGTRTAEGIAVRHALLAESVLETLSEQHRRGLHVALAGALTDPGEAARHHAAAGHRAQAHACALAAAGAATRPAERVAHLRLAALCADGDQADALRLEAAGLLVDDRETADVEELLDDVANPARRIRASVSLLRARARWWAGDPEGMRAAVAEGLTQAAGTDVEVRLRVQQARVAVAVDTVTPETLPLAERAWQQARDAGVDEAGARSLPGAAHHFLGSPHWAGHLRAALVTAHESGTLEDELRVSQTFVAVSESAGAQAEARSIAAQMRSRAAEARLTRWDRMFQAMLMNLDLHAGSYGAVVDTARALLSESVDLRLRNPDLRGLLLAELLGRAPGEITAGQVSYDLRRLRAHGLIERIPRSHRYRITHTGLHHAMLLTHIQTRLLQPGLAALTDPDPPAPTALRTAARNYQHALDQLTQEAGLAA